MAPMNRSRTGGSTATPGPATQGTLGGIKQAVGARPGRTPMQFGDEMYLWFLVILEVLLTAALRQRFSRYHGG